MVVYFHRNPITYEIFYVGIGNERRPYSFYESSRNKLWHRIVKKYGLPIVEIIHPDISKEDACKLEIEYIKKFGIINEGGILCNMSYGGDFSPMTNKETAKKVHDQLRGRKRPDMVISNPMRKPENRERARLSMLKLIKHKTPEQKERNRERARKMFTENNPLFNPLTKEIILRTQRKPVIQMDKQGIELLGHISINDAGRHMGKTGSKVYMCCAGQRKTAYGYTWKYAV